MNYNNTKNIHLLFKTQAENWSDRVALKVNGKEILYSNLDILSDTLAKRLISLNIRSGSPVVFFLQRSPEAIIAMLGILKAAGAYVPVDRSYPADRISFILQDCQPSLILTTRESARHLPETNIPLLYLDELQETATQFSEISMPDVLAEDPAYIIYTSGTTGTPKGVVIPHRGVLRLVLDQDYMEFGEGKTFLHLASLAFDAATFEIWGPLLHGGKCIIYPEEHIPDPKTLQGLIEKENISTLWLTATLFNTLITAKPDCLKGISELLIGGEALSLFHVQKALKHLPDTTIINGYGPTENTTFTTTYEIPQCLPSKLTAIPIGKPLNHTTSYILDKELIPVASGEVGELYTGGAGLALGYLNHPELTAKSFVNNPIPGTSDQNLYRTGDLVRQLPDGNLDYIDRIDDQVKIRGFRVELGEIRSTLLNHSNVKESVVLVHTTETQLKQIIAYVVFQEQPTSFGDLQTYLAEFLPEHMLPSCYVEIEGIPLNTNGKLEKKRLPQPSFETSRDFIGPSSKIEKQLAAIWSSLLKIERISIVDNFFDIGGTSLLSIELTTVINNTISQQNEIDPIALYQFPTIKSLAGHIKPEKSSFATTEAPGKNRARLQKASFGKFRKFKRQR